GIREARDLHVHQPGGPGGVPDVALRNLRLPFRADYPDRAVALEELLYRHYPLEVAALMHADENRVHGPRAAREHRSAARLDHLAKRRVAHPHQQHDVSGPDIQLVNAARRVPYLV